MSAKKAFEYWEAITALEASEILNLIDIQQFPDLKKGPARKWRNNLRRQALPSKLAKKKVLTTGQMVEILTKE